MPITPQVASDISACAEKSFKAARYRVAPGPAWSCCGASSITRTAQHGFPHHLVLASGRSRSGFSTGRSPYSGMGWRARARSKLQLPGQRSLTIPNTASCLRRGAGPQRTARRAYLWSICSRRSRRRVRAALICNNVMVSLRHDPSTFARVLIFTFALFFHVLSSRLRMWSSGSTWLRRGCYGEALGRRRQINRQVILPRSSPDWWTAGDLPALGRGIFSVQQPREIFDELLLASGRNVRLLRHYFERRRKTGFWPWPSNLRAPPGFSKERFYHPDGRATFHAIDSLRLRVQRPYPLILTNGRVVQYHPQPYAAHRPFLVSNVPEPYVEIHPKHQRNSA